MQQSQYLAQVMSLGIVIHNVVVQFDNPPSHPKMEGEMLSYRIFSSKKLVLTLKSNFQFFLENVEITLCIKGYQEFTLSWVSLFISLFTYRKRFQNANFCYLAVITTNFSALTAGREVTDGLVLQFTPLSHVTV